LTAKYYSNWLEKDKHKDRRKKKLTSSQQTIGDLNRQSFYYLHIAKSAKRHKCTFR